MKIEKRTNEKRTSKKFQKNLTFDFESIILYIENE
jgi:hypothetical protein